ncbi:DUF397 domain-containing protein [Saccharomonospora iraqiensis]|uniref:DUF397 domain-containing protein n=1 Tax=Saccharomonospora iraqiensis TaxID=52698 RepID=UPI000A010523|nr:DUF397 domain-containing protein [Saccharomonospora iraqiensis]
MSNASSRHPATGWFKSSFSNPSQECVEINFDSDRVHIRDSKDHGVGPKITIGAEHWPGVLAEALGHAEAGSNSAVRIEVGDDGSVRVQALDSHVILAYTRSEWAAFVAGAVDGEFDRPETAAALARINAA